MRNLFTLIVFLASVIGTIFSMFMMVRELTYMTLAFEPGHFAICAVSFVLCAFLFMFVRDEVVY
jgi:flagellar biosynthesis protein FliQ